MPLLFVTGNESSVYKGMTHGQTNLTWGPGRRAKNKTHSIEAILIFASPCHLGCLSLGLADRASHPENTFRYF